MRGYRDDELTARWVQCGVFSPIMRLHSTQNEWMSKEPWLYSAETEMAIKNFLRLRHRLLPYLHTMNVRAATEDEPIVQPLYWHYPETREATEFKNQYLFGTSLLLAPITSPRDKVTGLGKVKAWLPPGRHVDIFHGSVYDGDRTLNLHRDLQHYPVFASSGSIIPLDHDAVPGTGSFNPSNLELLLVVGQDGHFTLIEDDASGAAGAAKFPISYSQAEGALRIGAAPNASPDTRNWWLRVLACDLDLDAVRVLNDGAPLELSDESRAVHNGTLIHLGTIPTKAGVTIHLGRKDPQLRVFDGMGLLRELLMHAQIGFDLKTSIWAVLEGKEEKVVKVGRLESIEMPDGVRSAVLELLLADSREVDGEEGSVDWSVSSS